MAEPGKEMSLGNDGGIRPPEVYAIEERAAPEGIVMLALAGEFDLAAAPALRGRLEAVHMARGVLLDMAEVTFVDSSVLHVLLQAEEALRAAGATLVLAAAQPVVTRLLELTRAVDILAVAPTVEQGLERVAA